MATFDGFGKITVHKNFSPSFTGIVIIPSLTASRGTLIPSKALSDDLKNEILNAVDMFLQREVEAKKD